MSKHLALVDPAVRSPELEAMAWFNQLSPIRTSYHLPGLFGMKSLERQQAPCGIIIMGSLASVHDRKEWQQNLEAWVGSQIQKNVPVLGICYGHQMLAHMFGGKISHVCKDKTKKLGKRRIQFQPSRLLGAQAQEGELCVSHCEHVESCPKEFQVIATSDEVAVEGLEHRTLAVWGFQGHPEAGYHFLADRGHCETSGPTAMGTHIVERFLAYCLSHSTSN